MGNNVQKEVRISFYVRTAAIDVCNALIQRVARVVLNDTHPRIHMPIDRYLFDIINSIMQPCEEINIDIV